MVLTDPTGMDWYQQTHKDGKVIQGGAMMWQKGSNAVNGYSNLGSTYTQNAGNGISITYNQNEAISITENVLKLNDFKTQMETADTKKDGDAGNCYAQAVAMAKGSGADPIKGTVNGINAVETPKESTDYVNSQLDRGKSTVVGVERVSKTDKADGSTDHYVAISSRTTDLKTNTQTFGYFDPGSLTRESGTKYKFSAGVNGQLSGNTYSSAKKYNVTWVGKNR
jgi:hypothetical protein